LGTYALGWGSGVASGGVGHLDWDTATERTCTGSVHAADHADVVLSSNVSAAGLASWDGGLEWQINSLGIASAVLASNLGGDLHVDEGRSITGGIDLASVWASTVTVDLMKSHGDLSTGGDLGKSSTHHGHNSLGSSNDIIFSTLDKIVSMMNMSVEERFKHTPRVCPQVAALSPLKRVESCWKGFRLVPSRGVAGSTPMAEPAPPWSPTALTIAPWPATSVAAANIAMMEDLKSILPAGIINK
jgi:hypothetical protein